MTIVDKIDFILQSKNMSRRKLAIKAGIPPSSLQSAMERGKNISLDMLIKISNALEVDISELLELKPIPDEILKFFNGNHEAAMLNTEILEDKAIDIFLRNMGYDIYFDASRLSNPKGHSGDVMIIEDMRAGTFFTATYRDVNNLKGGILSFTKYQIYNLLENLKKIDEEEVGNYDKFNKNDEPIESEK